MAFANSHAAGVVDWPPIHLYLIYVFYGSKVQASPLNFESFNSKNRGLRFIPRDCKVKS